MRFVVGFLLLPIACTGPVIDAGDDTGVDDTGEDGGDTAVDTGDPCQVGMIGGGFYAELKDPQTDEMAAFLWTVDNCTITFSGFTYDLSGTIYPYVVFGYEGQEPQNRFPLQSRPYEDEDFTATMTPIDGVPPIGRDLGMLVWVQDDLDPETILLQGTLWAP